jgi:hypothetical protein
MQRLNLLGKWHHHHFNTMGASTPGAHCQPNNSMKQHQELLLWEFVVHLNYSVAIVAQCNMVALLTEVRTTTILVSLVDPLLLHGGMFVLSIPVNHKILLCFFNWQMVVLIVWAGYTQHHKQTHHALDNLTHNGERIESPYFVDVETDFNEDECLN